MFVKKIKNMKINRNVDELMMIAKKFTNYNVLFTLATNFDKCDLYSIRHQSIKVLWLIYKLLQYLVHFVS